jgi:hypothetical protein
LILDAVHPRTSVVETQAEEGVQQGWRGAFRARRGLHDALGDTPVVGGGQSARRTIAITEADKMGGKGGILNLKPKNEKQKQIEQGRENALFAKNMSTHGRGRMNTRAAADHAAQAHRRDDDRSVRRRRIRPWPASRAVCWE